MNKKLLLFLYRTVVSVFRSKWKIWPSIGVPALIILVSIVTDVYKLPPYQIELLLRKQYSFITDNSNALQEQINSAQQLLLRRKNSIELMDFTIIDTNLL